MGKKDCKKGYSCGLACINIKYNCTEGLKQTASDLAELYMQFAKNKPEASTLQSIAKSDAKFAKLAEYMLSESFKPGDMDAIYAIVKTVLEKPRASQSGVKSIELNQAEAFFETDRFEIYEMAYEASWDDDGKFNPNRPGGMADYISLDVQMLTISPELVEAVWSFLPDSFQTTFKSGGSPREGYWTGKFEEDGITPIKSFGKGSTARGKDTLRRYLEQKGLSPYTGQFVHLKEAQGEHLVPEELSGIRGDQLNNFAWISAAENKWHGKATPDEWRQQANKNILSRKAEYAKELDAKKSEAKSVSKNVANLAKSFESVINLSEAKERQAMMRGIAESFKGDKTRKLLEAEGMTKTFRTPYPTKLGNVASVYTPGNTKIVPYRREVPDIDSTVMAPILGTKQKPISLLFQAIAFAPEEKERLKAAFVDLMKQRELDLDDAMQMFLAEGSEESVKRAMTEKSMEFARNLKNLLDTIPNFTYD